MRSFFTLLFSVIFFAAHAQRTIDVQHYRFAIDLNDANDTIYGSARIHFIPTTNIFSIPIDLANIKSTKKGMTVTAVFPGTDDTKTLSFRHENNKLTIVLNKEIAKGDSAFVTILYKGIPSDGLIISKNKYGSRTFFADNWPNRAHNWLPCVDDPADKATVEFIVTAPSHYQVISNGVQIEETNLGGNKKLTHYKEDVPLPTKVMVIGAADFAVQHSGTIGCVPVTTWVYPENKTEGFYDFAIAKDVLDFYIQYIGPYAYKKLANVQSKTIFGGMENAGAIFYAESSVSGSREEERLIAHEIVHQWFGNMATEKSFAHFWLSEGFATYLTHVFLESKYGTEALNGRMKEDRETIIDFVKSSHRPVVDSTPDFMKLLNANSYQKGGWVLHMLRRELGDSVFKKSIRHYYVTYAGKNAETSDLQNIFESVSGKNLSQFFKQWLFTPENPSLQLTWSYDPKNKNVVVKVKQLQTTNFQLPLEISFIPKDGTAVIKKIFIDKKEQDFSFSFSEKPASAVADPFTSLLFEGKLTELK